MTDEHPIHEEVYDVEVDAPTNLNVHGQQFTASIGEEPSRWRVDDVSHGDVLLAGSYDIGAQRGGCSVTLDPDQARDLGTALVRAAAYAEEQRRASDGQ